LALASLQRPPYPLAGFKGLVLRKGRPKQRRGTGRRWGTGKGRSKEIGGGVRGK